MKIIKTANYKRLAQNQEDNKIQKNKPKGIAFYPKPEDIDKYMDPNTPEEEKQRIRELAKQQHKKTQ